jgi:hypothetical protein
MVPRTDVWSRLLSPPICLLLAGCFSDSGRGTQVAAQPQTRPAFDARAQTAPELRIPVEAGAPTGTVQDNSVTQISVQELAKPQAAIEDTSGPPLKAPEIGSPPPSSPGAKLRTIYREAAERYAAVDSYIVRFRRREQVNGRDKPEELMYVRFRKQPFSIYFKWLGKEAAGREVIYVKGQYEDKLHTLLAAGDMPFTPAGKRIALAPDSPLVRSSSRHTIHEAGIGVLINGFGGLVEAAEKGDTHFGTLRYLGFVKRPEFDAPCEGAEQEVRPGADPLLPRGGKRLWVFDLATKFPCLLITNDEAGHEVEYYCYDRFQFPVRLDKEDFDPDKLWNQNRPVAPKPNPR